MSILAKLITTSFNFSIFKLSVVEPYINLTPFIIIFTILYLGYIYTYPLYIHYIIYVIYYIIFLKPNSSIKNSQENTKLCKVRQQDWLRCFCQAEQGRPGREVAVFPRSWLRCLFWAASGVEQRGLESRSKGKTGRRCPCC